MPEPRAFTLTDEATAILRFAVEARTAGQSAALITLVHIEGGAARALGAQMVVREDGFYCGFVSGGCTEAAAAAEALNVIASGNDRQITYGAGSPYFDIVLPCGGGIRLQIHCLRSVEPLRQLLEALQCRRPAGLRYHPVEQRLAFIPGASFTGWHMDAFDTAYRPELRVIIHGRSIELEATAALARVAGYEVHANELWNEQADLIDADTAVVLLHHDLERELPVLRAALAASPFYIGALGSRRTHQRRCQRLIELGCTEKDLARVKAPIGLFPKARDAPSLALSVLADIAAARTRLGLSPALESG
jgi:xanthine dehydrogenase accessory factor